MGTIVFKAPVLRFARANAVFNTSNSFLYTFDHRGQFTRFKYEEDHLNYPFDGGVSHSDDNLYIFPYPSSKSQLNEDDTRIAKIMVDLWTSFAANGVPSTANGTSAFEWEPVTSKTSDSKRLRLKAKFKCHFRDHGPLFAH